jgi:hypothetical protein
MNLTQSTTYGMSLADIQRAITNAELRGYTHYAKALRKLAEQIISEQQATTHVPHQK